MDLVSGMLWFGSFSSHFVIDWICLQPILSRIVATGLANIGHKELFKKEEHNIATENIDGIFIADLRMIAFVSTHGAKGGLEGPRDRRCAFGIMFWLPLILVFCRMNKKTVDLDVLSVEYKEFRSALEFYFRASSPGFDEKGDAQLWCNESIIQIFN